MKVLAFDTSSKALAIAILEDDKLLSIILQKNTDCLNMISKKTRPFENCFPRFSHFFLLLNILFMI